MKWMETIRIQTAGNRTGNADEELLALVHDIRKTQGGEGPLDLLLCSHASMPGYHAIHILWDTDGSEIRGSLLGLTLAQALKSLGMVDHSVWIEKERDGPH